MLLCRTLAPPTLPTTVSCLAEQILLHFEFSAIFHQVGPLQDAFGPNAPDQVAQVQSPRFPVPRSSSKTLFEATPRFLHHFSEDILSLFVSSLSERILLHPHRRELSSSSSSSKFSLWHGLFGPARVSSYFSSFRGHSVSLCFEFIREFCCTHTAESYRASSSSSSSSSFEGHSS